MLYGMVLPPPTPNNPNNDEEITKLAQQQIIDDIYYEIFLFEELLSFLNTIRNETNPLKAHETLKRSLFLLDEPDFPESVYLARLRVTNKLNPAYSEFMKLMKEIEDEQTLKQPNQTEQPKVDSSGGDLGSEYDTDLVFQEGDSRYIRAKSLLDSIKEAIDTHYDTLRYDIEKKIRDLKKDLEEFRDSIMG
jgi:hypothetical protein